MNLPDRVFVISDLHLGPADKKMSIFHAGEALAKFIGHCGEQAGQIELVILGDALDFLQIEPAVTGAFVEDVALKKTKSIITANEAVFGALRGFCKDAKNSLVWVIGNHDLEIVFAKVRGEIEHALDHPARLVWILDDARRVYRFPDHSEIRLAHGNQGDPMNRVDYENLAQVARGGGDPARVYPLGSRLVANVFNPIKREGYAHIDLLKPEIEVALPLTLALWPAKTKAGLRAAVPLFGSHLAKTSVRKAKELFAGKKRYFGQPSDAGQPPPTDDVLIVAALLAPLMDDANAETRLTSWWNTAETTTPVDAPGKPMFGVLSDAGRRVLRGLTLYGAASDPHDIFGPCDLASQSEYVHRDGVKLLVTGHTHLSRLHERTGGYYINTGTWADLIRLPSNLSSEDLAEAINSIDPKRPLQDAGPFWLRPFRRLTYADIEMSATKPWSAALSQWPETDIATLGRVP